MGTKLEEPPPLHMSSPNLQLKLQVLHPAWPSLASILRSTELERAAGIIAECVFGTSTLETLDGLRPVRGPEHPITEALPNVRPRSSSTPGWPGS